MAAMYGAHLLLDVYIMIEWYSTVGRFNHQDSLRPTQVTWNSMASSYQVAGWHHAPVSITALC